MKQPTMEEVLCELTELADEVEIAERAAEASDRELDEAENILEDVYARRLTIWERLSGRLDYNSLNY